MKIAPCSCFTLCIDHDWDGEFDGSLIYTRPGGEVTDLRSVGRHDSRCSVAERMRIRKALLDWATSGAEFTPTALAVAMHRIIPLSTEVPGKERP